MTDISYQPNQLADDDFYQSVCLVAPLSQPKQNASRPTIDGADQNDGVDNNIDKKERLSSSTLKNDSTGNTAFKSNGQDANLKADDDQLDDIEGDDAPQTVDEKKESRLERYKQFLAEKFSNQTINHAEVRVAIEAGALPTKLFFVMNALSAIIASYGLIADSAAVVIGAMLIAMMLGPITGVALAIIDYRMPLLKKSLFTLIAGVILVIGVGFIVGSIHSASPTVSKEILSRTVPTSMDLIIALAGGTAGAYAMVAPHLSVAVVGVAVATALVPPLAASGVLLAHGEMRLGFGALLLALTNILAIQFTNALVLWFLGFRRLVEDDYKSGTYLTFLRRNAIPLLLLVGLGVYLTINLNNNAQKQAFENHVKKTINQYFEADGNVLTNTQFEDMGGFQTIRAVIRGETSPSSKDVRQIEAILQRDIAKDFPKNLPVKLQLRYLPVQVIEADPFIKEPLDKTDASILKN